MSVLCFQELGVLNSDLKEKVLRHPGLLKKIRSAERFFVKTSRAKKFMETSLSSTSQNLKRFQSLQGVFHARTSVSQEKRQESKAKGRGCGRISLKRLGFYDQVSQSLRTSQLSLSEGLTLCLETLPKSGMMQNGFVYELVGLELPTEEREFLLLPTPLTGEYKNHPRNWRAMLKRFLRGSFRFLRLNWVLGMVYELKTGKSPGQLNPQFLEWMMGFPKNWTDLKVLETLSFHKSLSSLPGESKKSKRRGLGREA